MRPTTAISFLLAAIVGACSKPNPDHCANQDGHKTCQDRGGDTKYCSKCVADNNGCVAEPVSDDCDAGSTSEPAGSTTDPTTAGNPTTSTSSTGTSTSTTSTTAPTTSDPSTTTTGDLTTSTTGTTDLSSTGTTLETTGTTLETMGTTLGTDTMSTETVGTTGTTTATTGDTDMPDPCGNNMVDPGETCDGTDLGAFDLCVQKNPTKYGGGALKCASSCSAYVEDNCCVATGQACPPAPQKCCKNPDALCLVNCG